MEGEAVVKGKGGDDERVCGGDDDRREKAEREWDDLEGRAHLTGASARAVRDVYYGGRFSETSRIFRLVSTKRMTSRINSIF